MSKIIDIIENMIQNSSKMSDIDFEIKVKRFFFSYKGYIWSIWPWSAYNNEEEGFSLAYYPFAKNLTEAKMKRDILVYSSDEFLDDKSFGQLYTILKEKFYKMDEVFDDILKD